MRSKTNPTIEAIKAKLRQEIGYMPGDSIPNSRVSKQLELLVANATLAYAKTLKRPVRLARPGECESQKKEIYKQYKTLKPKGMFTAKEAAEQIGISTGNLYYYNKKGEIDSERIGNRNYYSEDAIFKLRIAILQTV